MKYPKISIIVPSYNQGRYLEETLISIIDQQYPNLELFIVDGGSTDNSVEIIKKYQDKINWWVSEKDKGQSHAINKGLQKVSGEIFTWINSDDVLMPGSLIKVAGYFSSLPPDAGVIFGGTILFRDGKEIQTSWGYTDPSIERYLAGMAFSQPSAFISKKYFDKAGSNVSEQLHYGMDYDVFCRLACVCRFVPVKDVLSKYRLHEASKSVAEQDKFIEDWTLVFVSLCKKLKWHEVLDEMKTTALFDDFLSSEPLSFSFTQDKNITGAVDKRKILFYHLCYVLKSFYHAGRLDKARKLLKWLKKNYPAQLLKNEKFIPEIITRMRIPEPFLRLLIAIKK